MTLTKTLFEFEFVSYYSLRQRDIRKRRFLFSTGVFNYSIATSPENRNQFYVWINDVDNNNDWLFVKFICGKKTFKDIAFILPKQGAFLSLGKKETDQFLKKLLITKKLQAI